MVLLTSSLNSFVQLMGVLLIFLFVLALTYFTTKWLGGMQQAKMHNKNLQLVETLQIGSGKYVQIVKAGEIYLVIAVGKEEVSILAQLTKEQLTELPETVETPAAKQFKDIFEKFKEQKKG